TYTYSRQVPVRSTPGAVCAPAIQPLTDGLGWLRTMCTRRSPPTTYAPPLSTSESSGQLTDASFDGVASSALWALYRWIAGGRADALPPGTSSAIAPATAIAIAARTMTPRMVVLLSGLVVLR